MDFLEKLYSNQYFVPVLIIIVGILTVLFIIILISALKDSKRSKHIVQVAGGDAQDGFMQIDEKQVDLSIPMDKIKIKPTNKIEDVQEQFEVQEPELDQVQVPEQPEIFENVVDNITSESNEFEEVKIEAPSEIVENIQPIEESNDIKFEESPVASINDVKQAESELDSIAQTLLKAYQKESDNVDQLPELNEKVVSSDPINPSLDESNVAGENNAKSVEIPSFSDIPSPQPVKVVNSSNIIDSSKKENTDINNYQAEEYTIKK